MNIKRLVLIGCLLPCLVTRCIYNHTSNMLQKKDICNKNLKINQLNKNERQNRNTEKTIHELENKYVTIFWENSKPCNAIVKEKFFNSEIRSSKLPIYKDPNLKLPCKKLMQDPHWSKFNITVFDNSKVLLSKKGLNGGCFSVKSKELGELASALKELTKTLNSITRNELIPLIIKIIGLLKETKNDVIQLLFKTESDAFKLLNRTEKDAKNLFDRSLDEFNKALNILNNGVNNCLNLARDTIKDISQKINIIIDIIDRELIAWRLLVGRQSDEWRNFIETSVIKLSNKVWCCCVCCLTMVGGISIYGIYATILVQNMKYSVQYPQPTSSPTFKSTPSTILVLNDKK